MHAVYVPTRVGPTRTAKLEAAAAGDWSGGTLLLSLVGRPVPHRTRLTAAQLQRVVRQWARAVRAGEGTLRLGDERRGGRTAARCAPPGLPPAGRSAAPG